MTGNANLELPQEPQLGLFLLPNDVTKACNAGADEVGTTSKKKRRGPHPLRQS